VAPAYWATPPVPPTRLTGHRLAAIRRHEPEAITCSRPTRSLGKPPAAGGRPPLPLDVKVDSAHESPRIELAPSINGR
jgi:hypothetical protein